MKVSCNLLPIRDAGTGCVGGWMASMAENTAVAGFPSSPSTDISKRIKNDCRRTPFLANFAPCLCKTVAIR